MKCEALAILLLLTGCAGTSAWLPAAAPDVSPVTWNCGNGFIFDAYTNDQRAYLDIPGTPLGLARIADGVYRGGETRFEIINDRATFHGATAHDCEIDDETVSLRRAGFTFRGEGETPQGWQLRIYRHHQPLLIINGVLSYSNQGGTRLRDRKEGDTHILTADTSSGRVKIHITPNVCFVNEHGPYPVTVQIETPSGPLEGCGRYL